MKKTYNFVNNDVLDYFASDIDMIKELSKYDIAELKLQVFVDTTRKYATWCLLNNNPAQDSTEDNFEGVLEFLKNKGIVL